MMPKAVPLKSHVRRGPSKNSAAPGVIWRRLRLHQKLMVSYALLGAAVTALSMFAGYCVDRPREQALAERALVMPLEKQLTGLMAGASEEGFSYVLSGDVQERANFESRLLKARAVCAELSRERTLSAGERARLERVLAAVGEMDDAASAMFDGYERTGSVIPSTYTHYDNAIDAARDSMADLDSAGSAESAALVSTAHATAMLVTLATGPWPSCSFSCWAVSWGVAWRAPWWRCVTRRARSGRAITTRPSR
jgi:hypothetical protein